jgi:hypothetical protein
MPLHVRPIAISAAVICFFLFSFIGWFSGLSPYVCSKRALTGAALVYIAGSWAVRALNSILLSAMISNEINQQKDFEGVGKD